MTVFLFITGPPPVLVTLPSALDFSPLCGDAIVLPYGQTLQIDVPYGVAYVAQSEIYFRKIDLKTEKNPHSPSTAERVPYPKINFFNPAIRPPEAKVEVETPEDPTVQPDEELILDIQVTKGYWDALNQNVDDSSRVPPPNGLEASLFPFDVWTVICQELDLFELSRFLRTSKNIHSLGHDGEALLWRGQWYSRWPSNSWDEIGTHRNLKSWFCRYRAWLYFHSPCNRHVVFDLGRHTIKYVMFDTEAEVGWTLSSIDPIFELGPVNQKSWDDTSKLGEGPSQVWLNDQVPPECTSNQDIDEKQPGGWRINPEFDFKRICKSKAIRPWIGVHTPDRKIDWGANSVEASVAALCGNGYDSGIVISVGHASAWLEIVVNHQVIFSHVSLTPRNSNVVKGMLETLLEYEKSDDPYLGPWWAQTKQFDFCCIGGRFVEQEVEDLKKNMPKRFYPFEIVSSVEDRIYSAIVGALFSGSLAYGGSPVIRENSPKTNFSCTIVRGSTANMSHLYL